MILTTPFHPRTEAANRTGLWSHWQGYLAAERYQTSEKAEYWVIRNSPDSSTPRRCTSTASGSRRRRFWPACYPTSAAAHAPPVRCGATATARHRTGSCYSSGRRVPAHRRSPHLAYSISPSATKRRSSTIRGWPGWRSRASFRADPLGAGAGGAGVAVLRGREGTDRRRAGRRVADGPPATSATSCGSAPTTRCGCGMRWWRRRRVMAWCPSVSKRSSWPGSRPA